MYNLESELYKHLSKFSQVKQVNYEGISLQSFGSFEKTSYGFTQGFTQRICLKTKDDGRYLVDLFVYDPGVNAGIRTRLKDWLESLDLAFEFACKVVQHKNKVFERHRQEVTDSIKN